MTSRTSGNNDNNESNSSSPDILGPPGDAEFLISSPSPSRPFSGRQSLASPANFSLLRGQGQGQRGIRIHNQRQTQKQNQIRGFDEIDNDDIDSKRKRRRRVSLSPMKIDNGGASARSIRFDDVLLPTSPTMKLDGGNIPFLSPIKGGDNGNYQYQQDNDDFDYNSSPWRIRVTLQASQDDGDIRSPRRSTRSPTRRSPTRKSPPKKRKLELERNTKTTKVPLRSDIGENELLEKTPTPKRRRGRPSKEDTTIVPGGPGSTPLPKRSERNGDDDVEEEMSPQLVFDQEDGMDSGIIEEIQPQSDDENDDDTPDENTLHAGHTPKRQRVYPTPTPSQIDGKHVEIGEIGENTGEELQIKDPTDEHREFDSIMESEGFSVVSLNTLPSAKERGLTLQRERSDEQGDEQGDGKDHQHEQTTKSKKRLLGRIIHLGIALRDVFIQASSEDFGNKRERLEKMFKELGPRVQRELRIGTKLGEVFAKKKITDKEHDSGEKIDSPEEDDIWQQEAIQEAIQPRHKASSTILSDDAGTYSPAYWVTGNNVPLLGRSEVKKLWDKKITGSPSHTEHEKSLVGGEDEREEDTIMNGGEETKEDKEEEEEEEEEEKEKGQKATKDFTDKHYKLLREIYREMRGGGGGGGGGEYELNQERKELIGNWIWTSDGKYGTPVTPEQFKIIDRFVQLVARADLPGDWTDGEIHRRLISIIIGEKIRSR